jgi:hypothetical protein
MVVRLGHIGKIKKMHNDAMTKIITCWKNDVMVKGLDLLCGYEQFKFSHLQFAWMCLVILLNLG